MEAVAIDIAPRAPGRIKDILVQEGETVAAGQVLAHMDTLQLEAKLREARAQLQRSRIAREVAQSGQTQREAERSAALAVLAQRTTELAAAERRLQRSEQLALRDAVSLQTLDDDRTRAEGAKAAR
ncbi:MAG: biotin/lipoyl-binding protein, partial [Xanthobacteraceae bacterium]